MRDLGSVGMVVVLCQALRVTTSVHLRDAVTNSRSCESWLPTALFPWIKGYEEVGFINKADGVRRILWRSPLRTARHSRLDKKRLPRLDLSRSHFLPGLYSV